MSRAALSDYAARFAESRLAVVSLAITVVFLLAALLAPVIAPTDPYDLSQLRLSDSLRPSGSHRIVPGEEKRVTVAVADGVATIRGEAGGLTATPCGPGCLALATPADVPLASLEVRDPPRGSTVEGATKHPVRPWWTVNTPKDNTIRITSAQPLPASFSVAVNVRSADRVTNEMFLLGTDGFGRDMLSAILYGIRISVFVGIVAAGSAMLIGTGLGLLSAWRRGVTDAIIMRAVDFMLSFPAILVGLAILAVLGSGVGKVILAVVLVQWCYYARTARSLALSELGKEYVEAARCLRLPAWRIMLRHVLPNCMPQIIVLFTLNIAAAIALESSLSFLGVGLPLTRPSLGMLIANGYEYIFSQKYWISFYPGLVLLVMIVAMNLLGDRLRDLNNPRLER
jgi:peptide/nickel transport system permease protein